MPKKLKYERYAGKYFSWTLLQRNGVFWADGRSNSINAGRHSLGTKIREEAVDALQHLDLTIAVQHGLADPELLEPQQGAELPLDLGRKLYEDHTKRPKVQKGIRKSSQKRYKAVLDKLFTFVNKRSITTWNRITTSVVEKYLLFLDGEDYAHATMYLEGTTIKQIVNFFIRKKHLPQEAKITLVLEKPQGTDTYCWRTEEVIAIRELALSHPELRWLYNVVTTLTFTGLRIGELINLRWSDVDFTKGMIRLVDESTSSRKKQRGSQRTLKSGRNRSFPIHDELRPVLESIARNADGYVFHGPLGGRLKADTVRNILVREVLKPLAKKFPTPPDEIGFKDGRLHSFRHFFCSLCAHNKVPQQTVMSWLGHQNSKLIAHYYHLYDDEAHRQMGKIKLETIEVEEGEENV